MGHVSAFIMGGPKDGVVMAVPEHCVNGLPGLVMAAPVKPFNAFKHPDSPVEPVAHYKQVVYEYKKLVLFGDLAIHCFVAPGLPQEHVEACIIHHLLSDSAKNALADTRSGKVLGSKLI